MSQSAQFLPPSEAARRLGVSPKALRLYEQRGLISPVRTAAGWRIYGPVEMTRAAEIVALRSLGLSLADVAGVLNGDPDGLAPALATHATALEGQIRGLAERVERVRTIRAGLDNGQISTGHQSSGHQSTSPHSVAPDSASRAQMRAVGDVSFDLPWPWGGETFQLRDIRALNYIIGPLGSGKTRFAQMVARSVPEARFLDLQRTFGAGATMHALLDADSDLKSRVDRIICLLVDQGAGITPALTALVTALASEDSSVLVVDMVEQGLDHATQVALTDYLRQHAAEAPPLFLMTRSSAILDLRHVGSNETITFCPANHSPPIRVAPFPGAPGYEAVATCLATPEVRARTEGVIAWRPDAKQYA